MTRRRHRRGDPDTSVEAADAIEEFRTLIQRRVKAYATTAGPAGFTHKELQAYMAVEFHDGEIKEKSTYRTRCSELRDDGIIKDSGRRRVLPGSRRKHVVWTLSQYAPQH